MANEFVARKGIISLDSIQVTGSISATGGIIISGSISSASYASNAELLDGRDSTIFATTGSNIFQANQTICANLTTTGTITAQTINVQQVTSSVVYSSGSNVFGNQLINTQEFTGSMFITGSTLNVTGGSICGPAIVGGTVSGTTGTFSSSVTGSGLVTKGTSQNNNSNIRFLRSDNTEMAYIGWTNEAVNNSCWYFKSTNGNSIAFSADGTNQNLFISTNGNVGIGTTSPYTSLDVIIGTASTTIGSGGVMTIRGKDGAVGQLVELQFLNGAGNVQPHATIGLIRTSATSYETGDLYFATKAATTNTAPTERIRITSDGCVGIGTNSPGAQLDVYTLGGAGGCFRNSGGGEAALTIEACGNSYIQFMNCSDGQTGLMFGNQCLQFSGMIWYRHNHKQLMLGANNTEILYLCGGNVGIGTSSPKEKLEISGYTSQNIRIYGRSGVLSNSISSNLYYDGTNWLHDNTSFGASYISFGSSSDTITFATTSSTTGDADVRMRITSIGNLELSCNLILNTGSNKYIRIGSLTNYYYDVRMSNDNFQIAEAGSTVRMSINYPGGITCFSSTVCAPCFATISDYRMKSNLRPIEGLSIIMNTKPYKFNYNYDCSTSFGVIAHELQEVLPEAVFGVKDGEVMQGVDYMKLLPIAIKAIQEQQCKIKTLESCLGIN